MNERIRQLAEQSQLWDRLDPRSLGIPGGSTESRWGEELQEFAELIVRECADTAFLVANSRKVQRAVLQHFGVAE